MLKKQDLFAAYTLMVTGTLQLIFLLFTFTGVFSDPFTKMVYEVFHISALYLPALQFMGAYLIINRPFKKELFYYTITSIAIFFPVSALLKLLFSDKRDPVVDFFRSAFDTPDRKWGSALVLLFLILILVLSARIVVQRLMAEPVEKNEDEDTSEGEEFVHNEEEIVELSKKIQSQVDEELDTNATSVTEEDLPVFDIELDEPDFEEPDLDETDLDETGLDKAGLEGDLTEVEEYGVEEEDESELLTDQISRIKDEIRGYYTEQPVEDTQNIVIEEPQFPEKSESVDIDAYDQSNDVLSEIINTELTKEEEDYLNSFDEIETFSASSEIIMEEDPALDFLSSDDDYYEDDVIDYDQENYNQQNSHIEPEPEYVSETEIMEDPVVPVEHEVKEDPVVPAEPVKPVVVDEPEKTIDSTVVESVKSEEPLPEPRKILTPTEPTYDELNQEIEYEVKVDGILNSTADNSYAEIDDATKRSAAILEQTLEEFNIQAKVTGIKKGPVITMFEVIPAPGVKLSKIVGLSDNIALGLAASTVRILAPIPGKHAVGIEVPNKKRAIVTFNEMIEAEDEAYDESAVPIVLGKSVNGDNRIIDLAKTPHMLIAGATGAGKSVCVNSLICSILCKRSPQDVKLIMVDPKIVELKLYNGIPHLLTPVITDPKRAFQAIQWCLYEMERRYALLDSLGVRDIKTYNKRIKEQKIATTKLPYLILIVDEFADLMATSGKELEGILARLAAMSRAVGIHLVLATQRPSTDVITGLIKANFPSRIAFMVSSSTDSRIILDGQGAEKLLGRGDMLFTSSWEPFPVRIQGSFLDDEEVEGIVDYVKQFGEPDYIDDEIFLEDDDDGDDTDDKTFFGDDPLYNRALEVVLTAGKASASFLQRRLKIGYNRAARLVEEMEERGIIGPQNGSKPREILKVPESHREVEEFV